MSFFYVSKLKTSEITHNPYNARVSRQLKGHKYKNLAKIGRKSAKSAKIYQKLGFSQILVKKFFFCKFSYKFDKNYLQNGLSVQISILNVNFGGF